MYRSNFIFLRIPLFSITNIEAVGSGCGSVVDRSLLTPEVSGLNRVNSKFYMFCQLYWKNFKETGNGPSFSKTEAVAVVMQVVVNDEFDSMMRLLLKSCSAKTSLMGGRHSSMVLSAPTILRPRVWIPNTPSTLFSICIEIVSRKKQKKTKRGWYWPFF